MLAGSSDMHTISNASATAKDTEPLHAGMVRSPHQDAYMRVTSSNCKGNDFASLAFKSSALFPSVMEEKGGRLGNVEKMQRKC